MRVWDSKWATDVTSFAWSPSGKYLYVATRSIYNQGALFELDLVKKTYKKIFPSQNQDIPDDYFFTKIESYDIKSNEMKVDIYSDDKRIASSILQVKK